MSVSNTALPPAAHRRISQSEFNTAMVHLYRGEVGRANTWRTRLDGTTNWAVLTTGATLSFAFSSTENTHVMILVNSLLIMYFLFIEARRYMFYDMWRSRVRLMEIEFFSEMLTPTEQQEQLENWRELLADDLQHPRFSISIWKAVGRRLRRNYIWIFGVLLLSWVVKILIHPFAPQSIDELYYRAHIGPVPSWFVLMVGVVFNTFLFSVAFFTRDTSYQSESGETMSRDHARQHIREGEAIS